MQISLGFRKLPKVCGSKLLLALKQVLSLVGRTFGKMSCINARLPQSDQMPSHERERRRPGEHVIGGVRPEEGDVCFQPRRKYGRLGG